MATITGTGVGSGLDVNSIVSSLMAVEQRSLNLLRAEATSLQTRLSAFGTLQSQIASLGDVATRLANPANWSPMQADSSDASAVSASAGAGAQAGSHSLQVHQLAQAQLLASRSFASAGAVVGTGTLRIELGSTAADGSFVADAARGGTVTIDAGRASLAGVRDAINNAAGVGVTASIVQSGGGARLVLRGPEGASGSLRVTATDDGDGLTTDAVGLSVLAFDPAAGVGSGRNLQQTQAAQDARLTLNGLDITSPGNTVSAALEGVTLTLRKTTTEPVRIGLALQAGAVRRNVNDFVNAYNALNNLLQKQTQADPTGKSRGALQADPTAVGLLSQARALLRGEVAGSAGGPASLNAAGLVLQRDGTLQIDEARLAPLLDEPARLARLFTRPQATGDAPSRGFAERVRAWTAGLAGASSPVADRIDGLRRSAGSNERRQDEQQARLERTEARLRAQYQRLDGQMADLQARMAQMKSSLGLA